VIGVNSFGAESSGAEAEFYFAVSARELLAFLPQNNRDIKNLATLAPQSSIEGERRNLALSGQRGINTNVTIDGVDGTRLVAGFGDVTSGDGRVLLLTGPQMRALPNQTTNVTATTTYVGVILTRRPL